MLHELGINHEHYKLAHINKLTCTPAAIKRIQQYAKEYSAHYGCES
jgi:hypothetical protein